MINNLLNFFFQFLIYPTTVNFFVVVFFPLCNFISLGIFGRYIGRLGAFFLSFFFLLFSFIIVFFLVLIIFMYDCTIYFKFSPWFFLTLGNFSCSFLFDSLSILMLFLVFFVSVIVHLYSYHYLELDPHIIRFLSYLSLFTFFMIILLTADNLCLLFVGWEGVGLCSYLLISFWSSRLQAVKSAMKAILYNRIGDCGLLIALGLCYFLTYSLDFSVLFVTLPYFCNLLIINVFGSFPLIDFVLFFFFVAAIGKSAQFFLHVWLADAMEGPTPVSALIHAATMVTAGIYLFLRISFLLDYTFYISFLICFLSLLTILFASITGFYQYDLKKVIAYSTCSQLGYMMLACSFNNYTVALFHLINHGFFKALLFLGAGLIIHFMKDEQDFRKMGGLFHFMPMSYSFFFVGSFSIMGIPFLSGSFSKDFLLESSLLLTSQFSLFFFLVLYFSIILTILYSLRLFYYIFLSFPNGFKNSYLLVSKIEAPDWLLYLLGYLAFFSIVSGYLLKDIFIGLGTDGFLFSFSSTSYLSFLLVSAEFVYNNFFLKSLPYFFIFCGYYLLFVFYFIFDFHVSKIFVSARYRFFFFFCTQGWFINLLYRLIGNFFLTLLKFLFFFDKSFFERIGLYGFIITIYESFFYFHTIYRFLNIFSTIYLGFFLFLYFVFFIFIFSF